jgi:hypothetical protein
MDWINRFRLGPYSRLVFSKDIMYKQKEFYGPGLCGCCGTILPKNGYHVHAVPVKRMRRR